MTKAEIVNEVAKATGIEKVAVQTVVEAAMESIKSSLIKGNPVEPKMVNPDILYTKENADPALGY